MKTLFFRQIALFCSILLVLTSCNLPGRVSTEAGGSQESTTFELSPGGGSITLDAISVNFSSSSINESSTLPFVRMTSEPVEDDQILVQSDTYVLSDLPVDFDGTMDVVFEIPREVLSAVEKSDPDRANKIILMVGIDEFSQTGGGETYNFLPVKDAVVDLETRSVSATIDLSNTLVTYTPKKLASMSLPNQRFSMTYWDVTPNSVRFKVVASRFSWNQTTYSSNYGTYTIYFNTGDFGASLDALMVAIDETELALVELGFTPKPVDIYVEDPGAGKEGQFGWNSYHGYHISIRPALLTGATANEPLLTFGHEFMHYMQALSYPEGSDKNSFISLDEAVAVWFESFLIMNNDYVAGLADQHLKTALYTPWFSGSSLEMQRAGYGASWYIHYLTKQNGNGFIRQAYTGGYTTGQSGWSQGIKDAYGRSNDILFPQYLADLYLKPDNISGGIVTSVGTYNDIFENWLKLEKTPEGPVTFTPYSGGIPTDQTVVTSIQAGSIIGGLPPDPYTIEPVPTLNLSKTLYPWNGYAFSIKLDPSLYPYDVGQLEVQFYDNVPSSGMMIFGIPLEGNITNAVPINGPESIVTGESFDTIVINSVSTKDNDGKYKEILFILYNAGDAENFMNVQIQFKPIQPAQLRGTLEATKRLYPNNPCSAIENCSPYFNPPPCTSQFSGGGGMGDCEPNCVAVVPCTQEAPEFCYWCSEYVGASQMVGAYMDAGPSIGFMIDENGEIQPFESPFGFQQVTPDVQYNPDGSFSMTWTENDNNQKPYVKITMAGKVDSSGGTGTWSYEYQGVGTLFSGTWKMSPSTY